MLATVYPPRHWPPSKRNTIPIPAFVSCVLGCKIKYSITVLTVLQSVTYIYTFISEIVLHRLYQLYKTCTNTIHMFTTQNMWQNRVIIAKSENNMNKPYLFIIYYYSDLTVYSTPIVSPIWRHSTLACRYKRHWYTTCIFPAQSDNWHDAWCKIF